MKMNTTLELTVHDRESVRRHVNDQERANGCVVRTDVPAPLIGKAVHTFVRPNGTWWGCAEITGRLMGGWTIRFGRVKHPARRQGDEEEV